MFQTFHNRALKLNPKAPIPPAFLQSIQQAKVNKKALRHAYSLGQLCATQAHWIGLEKYV